MTYGTTGDDISDDSNGAMGDNDDVDGEGTTGDYVDNDGGGVMGDNDGVDGKGVTGNDDNDDGDGAAMTTTSMAMARWATTSTTLMATTQRDMPTTMAMAQWTMMAMA
jgi:hypothetical protein